MSSQPHTAGEADPLDRARLTEISEGMDGLAEELVSLFLEDAGLRLETMRSAAERGEAEELWREAHTLKGSAASVGAARTSRLSLELEMAGRSGDLAAAAALIRAIGDELERVRAAVAAGL